MNPNPKTMRAWIVDAPDAPFREIELPIPEPRAGEVLVRVEASGVNPLDTKIRAGSAAHARHPLPAVLGIDLAGSVERVGEGVSGFAPGDAVWGAAGGVGGIGGSMAQWVAVDARLLARQPTGLSMREAAALPLAAITAWEGLVDNARVQAGESVLVIGAAGGVGHVATQLALARGARVFRVASERDAGYLRSLGAHFVDRAAAVETWVDEHTGGRGFDVVYDSVGALDAAFQAVRPFGRVTSALGWGTVSLAPLSLRSAQYAGVFTLRPLLTGQGREAHGQILVKTAALVEAGRLSPRLEPRRFAIDQADAAHARVREGQARGKVVLELG
ncbi:zinc-dependent alcohol dehydrogenase family protein [Burkholderia sp. ISTR5]|uniref:zinc-dependent alcohol dehydrogenase family protein n=1 Tax=Burkholderia sp. ISTR5 TaxID=2500161 RepID=UPI00137156CD|nr:zinc-dependent alcohol dehydrogenase family protein [Burkholderia sp. ISTR5]NBI45480.1 quinone oxidoreductase [Burkholderia sp. ISTR5]